MPAAAVIRRGQALSGFTGCKGSVDGVASLDVSTAGSTTVKNVLARYNDDRIRVVKAENKSIAENTNVGISSL